ncbi:MAG: hypothetical protein DGJ47_000085 [Rickettsiaceae bacterium]
MKKIILTTAAIVAISSTNAIATETNFYFKASAGASALQKTKKLDNKTTGIFNFGAGYHINHNLRADITIDHLIKPSLKTKSDDGLVVNPSTKLGANSLLLNLYSDIYSNNTTSLFVGAGIGASRITGKVNFTDPNEVPRTGKIKESRHFAYALYTGVSTRIDHDIYGEITYSFKDYGNIKTLNVKNKVRSHNLTVGLRVDI